MAQAVIINNVCAAFRKKQPEALRAVPTGGTTKPVSPGIIKTAMKKVQQEIRQLTTPKLPGLFTFEPTAKSTMS